MMTPREGVLGVLLCGALILAVAERCGNSDADLARSEDARARIDALTATLEAKDDSLVSALALVDSVEAVAVRSDTVLVRIVDSVAVAITVDRERSEVADSAFGATMDSLASRVASDPVALQWVETARAQHSDAVEAERSVSSALRVQLGATEESLTFWRASDAAKDAALARAAEVTRTQARIIAEHEARDVFQERVIRRQTWQIRLTRVVAVASTAAVSVQAIRGGG